MNKKLETKSGHNKIDDATIDKLVLRGKKRGIITEADIMDVIGPHNLDAKELQELRYCLEDSGLSIEEGALLPDQTLDTALSKLSVQELRKLLSIPQSQISVENISLSDESDIIRSYLREIGKVSLLTPQIEMVLAQKVQDGLKAGDALGLKSKGQGEETKPKLPKARRDKLERIYNEGQEARDLIIEANLRLVVSVAKHFKNRGLGFLDLIQEGNLGLLRAAEKFDHKRGFKFSTYAIWWIKQSIIRALAIHGRSIKVPVQIADIMSKIGQCKKEFFQQHGRDPRPEEISEQLGIPLERIIELEKFDFDTVSLERPVGEETDTALYELIEDQSAEVPLDAAAQAMLNEAVNRALSELPPRERSVVILRFGLDGGNFKTLDEVSELFGVTRERVRQIEAKTLAKLRHPILAQKLRQYFENF
jgi:RNA polymerase primary sigma factor